MSLVVRFIRDESGATATEFGLIVAGISLAIVTLAFSMATQLRNLYVHVLE